MVVRNLVSSWVFGDELAWRLLETVTPVVVPWLQLLGLGGVVISLWTHLATKADLKLRQSDRQYDRDLRLKKMFLTELLPKADMLFGELRETGASGGEVPHANNFRSFMILCDFFLFEVGGSPGHPKIGQVFLDEWQGMTEECEQVRWLPLSLVMVDIYRVIKEEKSERN
jgi:hypothetical protein